MRGVGSFLMRSVIADQPVRVVELVKKKHRHMRSYDLLWGYVGVLWMPRPPATIWIRIGTIPWGLELTGKLPWARVLRATK